ncbi:MAG: XdhC family protein [Candidatus Latescibacteria bacterium]|nr:XdhC family protein [Candidatus Latescibacterota bacterium]
MEAVFREVLNILGRGETAALSTIVSSKGSLPMSKKAKMLVRQDGTFVGTVGGGCLEADVWSEARQVMETGKPSLQRFILTEKHAGESGLNCGGNVEIFTEPICSGVLSDVLESVVRLQETRGTGVLATLVAGEEHAAGRKLLVTAAGETVGTLGDPALDERVCREADGIIREDLLKVFTVEQDTGEARVFVESILPDPQLFLFGAGHVSRAIARIAKTVGFRLIVIDDRPAFASPERFPDADQLIVDEFDGIVEKLPIDEQSYLVAVTRGHQWDQPIIAQAVWTRAKYIGMIGSRRKVALMWKHLEAQGIPRALLERVHAPIGLDINADTPDEIAVSIVAELINVRRARGKPGHTEEQMVSESAFSQA